jgi:hypothetical protein
MIKSRLNSKAAAINVSEDYHTVVKMNCDCTLP